jgi:hypothetical protein
MRFMPAGIDKAVFPKNFDNADAYDLFLGKIICYAFSLPNTWLEQKSTRANAEQTQDAAMAEGLMPYLQYWSELWDYMIAWGFGYTDIECVPKHQREIDVLKQAQADEIRTRNGHLSVDEVRADLGENEIGQPPAVFVPATGYVTIGTEGKDEAAEVAEQASDAEGGKPATPNADAQKPTGEEIAPPDRAVKMNKAENAGKKKLKMLPMTGHQKAERHLTEALTKFFKKEGRRVAGVMTKANEPTLAWKDLIPVFEPQLASVGKRGALQALAQVSVTDEKITDSVSDEAMTYAKERAGELVGMRWNGSEWIENPDAKWAITDSTRAMVRAVVDAGTKEQLSTDALASRIMESTAFSPERAAMIARTELAFAHTQGSLSGWKGSGVVTGKESILSQDHTGDDECDQAADDGEVPIDAPFSTGDDGPPYHPNCECALLAVLGEEDENTPADF